MKNLRLYFYIILQTLMSINCEEYDESEDPVLFDSFTDDTGHDQFVDPFSFDYDRANKKMGGTPPAELFRNEGTSPSNSECELKLKECIDARNIFEHEGSFARRLINMLLSNAKLKESGDLLEGSIILSGTKEQIEKLREYGNGKITPRQIDAILTDVIIPSIGILEEARSFIDRLIMFFYQYASFLAALLAASAVLLFIKFVNWSTGKVIILFLFVIFVTSFFMIWFQLIKNAETKRFVEMKKYKRPPSQCDPENMSYLERVANYFYSGDKCFEYYKGIDFDPLHAVTPLDVLIELFDKSLIQPVGRFGSGISHFINNATEHLGFPMKWVVTILLYIGIVFFIIVMPFSVFGGALRLSFGPFFRIFLGKGQTDENNQQHRLQPPQQAPAIAERREPITVILQLHSNGGAQHQLSTNAVVQAIENNQLSKAGGDSESNANREVDGENSSDSCKKCYCKETLSSSILRVEEPLALENESTKSGQQRDEKGDGDC